MRLMVIFLLWFQTPIPTPTPPLPYDEDAQDVIATAEAVENDLPLSTDGEQIYSNGQPMLPILESPALATTFSYMKGVLDANVAQGMFGPFYPIIASMRIFLTLALIWLVFYFVQSLVTVLIKFALFLIRYLIPFLG